MRIHSYVSSGGKDFIMDYISSLQRDEKIDGLSVLEDLENDRLETLWTKRWRGKIWEVYFRKHHRVCLKIHCPNMPPHFTVYLLPNPVNVAYYAS